MQLFVLCFVIKNVPAVVQHAVLHGIISVDMQPEGVAERLCFNAPDARDLIIARFRFFHIIVFTGETEVITAPEVERKGGLGLQRKRRAYEGRALGQPVENRIIYTEIGFAELPFVDGQARVRKLTGIFIEVKLGVCA